MQIPESSKINTGSLSRLFDNKSESYKLFWFKAILHEVGMGKSEIKFGDLIDRMILDAWYMVSEYKLNLGPADTLEKTVIHISENQKFLTTEKEDTLLDYLRRTDDKTVWEYKKTLSLNVPYRLQAPLMDNPDSKLWYNKAGIVDYINMQDGMMYSIEHVGTLDSSISISPAWMDYLQSNLGILLGWTDYNLIIYLQRRNPSVPGISNKIYPPQERKLTVVSDYWKYMIKQGNVRDIYTENLLTTRDVSIDHFVPWSYVASDELWNLIPTEKSVNSSKSNNLPVWDKYFNQLAMAEYNAYTIVQNDDKAKHLFDKCVRENLNSEDIKYRLYHPGQSRDHFIGQLEDVLTPVYNSAHNMGFREWMYKK